MSLRYLICENCKQVIARFDSTTIRYPIKAEDFESHLAERGVRAPWAPGVEPAMMKCPVCPKRAFHNPDPYDLWVSDTVDGLNSYRWMIPTAEEAAPGPDEFEEFCPICGRGRNEFKNGSGFANHIRFCAAKQEATE